MTSLIKKIYPYLFLLPFLFPFIYKLKIPIKTWGNLNGLDLVLILLIILGFTVIFKNQQWLSFKKFLNQTFLKKIGLFLIIVFISFVFNLDSNWIHELSLIKSFLILPILYGMLVLFFVKEKLLNYWHFFYCYLIYSSGLAILTISFKFLNLTTFDNRIKLFFDSPNQLAIALALGIISAILLTKNKPRNFVSFFIPAGGLILLLPALFLTKSLGSILAVLIILIILSIKKICYRKVLITKIVVLVSLFFLLLLLLTPFLIKKINYDPFLNQNSLDSRLAIYSVTSKLISNNFWDGIGMKNFQNYYLSEQNNFPPYPQWAVPHSHNLLAQIWLSFGIWGLFFWIVLLLKQKNPLNKEIFYLFLIYFLIHGLVDVPIWNNDQALFFWFIMFF